MNEIDEELAKFIEESMSNSNGNYCEALNKVVAYQKEHRDLTSIHISIPLDILCGKRKVEDPREKANEIAKNTLLVMLASARGQLRRVTSEELEVM